MMDMTQAAGLIISAWASMRGKANPVMTMSEVRKRPKSTAPEPSSSAERSSEPQCANIAFGSGATANVRAIGNKGWLVRGIHEFIRVDAPTIRGNQFAHSVQDRMMRRNPTASTNSTLR